MDLETIIAPATAPGRSGVAVIRMSGPLALEIGRIICGEISQPMFLRPCSIKNSDKKTVDHGLVVFFKGPASYTGEDVVEIHCHGNPIIVDLIIKEALVLGARVAEPGEFTKRSFLNDKIDLAQAESVADLISAQTDSAVLGANTSLSGEFSNKINNCIDALVNLRVIVEAAIDFPDEETPDEDVQSLVKSANGQIQFISDLIKSSEQGALIREGLRVVILGAPNVGKSTLLNCFAKENLAIVSNTPGTTRDLISANTNLGGVPVEFVDTAGLRMDSQDSIEIEGMKRAKKAVDTSNLVLEIVDARDFHDFERLDENSLLVFNKMDLLEGAVPGEGVFVSASKGEGVLDLIEEIMKTAGLHPGVEIPALSRRRHILCLENAKESLEESVSLLNDKSSLELVAECLLSAQTNLGEITNPVSSDDLLGEIFSEFCIGK
ncbi:tRNA uridine-5-carboxymethylaminomethyl(34) synthesis GTPase MnmE [Gammaproteobacteria bacterium]|nr:tRNA uridine-5-carboxymethylaminomethyl(34) synthesis GTPase MnmE [Gammaproteobacteria bacterium]